MGREIIVFFKRDVSRHLKESDVMLTLSAGVA